MRHALVLFGLAVALIITWGILFSTFENVGTLTGLYWAITTATTVGYGDVTPHAASGHLLAVLTMLTAIPTLAASFSMLTSWHIRRHTHRRLDEQDAKHELAISGIRNILLKLEDHDGPGRP